MTRMEGDCVTSSVSFMVIFFSCAFIVASWNFDGILITFTSVNVYPVTVSVSSVEEVDRKKDCR